MRLRDLIYIKTWRKYLIILFWTLLTIFGHSVVWGQKRILQTNQAAVSEMSGEWLEWRNCDKNTFLTGFRVNYWDYFGSKVLKKIMVYCGPIENIEEENEKFSRINNGKWNHNKNSNGFWSEMVYCDKDEDSYAKGFQLELSKVSKNSSLNELYSEKERNGNKVMFVGISNIRLYCESPSTPLKIMEKVQPNIGEHSEENGFWTEEKFCSGSNSYLCGIQTQIKFSNPDSKLIGINNIRMKCCKKDSLAQICQPIDKRELLFEYDNSFGFNHVKYSYNKKVGVERLGGFEQSFENEDLSEEKQKKRISQEILILKDNFINNLCVSNETGFDWTVGNAETFSIEKSFPIEIDLRPGSHTKIYQIIGYCGDYIVRPSRIYQNGEMNMEMLKDLKMMEEIMNPQGDKNNGNEGEGRKKKNGPLQKFGLFLSDRMTQMFIIALLMGIFLYFT